MPPSLDSPSTYCGGEGFWFVLEGPLDFWIGQDQIVPGGDDCADFDQRHSYRMRNQRKEAAWMIRVAAPALL